MLHNTANILLIEDDEVDVEAVERSLRKLQCPNPIRVCCDGYEALKVLRGDADMEPLPRPYLILLDLKLPRMNGIKFLEELRNDPKLRNSIVFVLTSSDADRDKLAAYNWNVAGYLVKSKTNHDCFTLVEMLVHYCRIVEFPPTNKHSG